MSRAGLEPGSPAQALLPAGSVLPLSSWAWLPFLFHSARVELRWCRKPSLGCVQMPSIFSPPAPHCYGLNSLTQVSQPLSSSPRTMKRPSKHTAATTPLLQPWRETPQPQPMVQPHSEPQQHPFPHLLPQGLLSVQLSAPFCCYSCCHHGNSAVTMEMRGFGLLTWVGEVTPQPSSRLTWQDTGTQAVPLVGSPPGLREQGWGEASILHLTLLFHSQITSLWSLLVPQLPPFP